MQSLTTTQERHIKDGTYSAQRGGHGNHGQTRLHQQGNSLLANTYTYRILNKDPTNKLKNKLIQTFKDIKQSGGLSNQKYKKMYPTSAVPPKFYGHHKIHKVGTPQAHSIQ